MLEEVVFWGELICLKNNDGFALIQVQILLTLLVILSTAFIAFNAAEVKQDEGYFNDLRAYYSAKSGQEIALRMHENNYIGKNCYFYGNSESITGPVSGNYVLGTDSTIDESPIITNATWTGDNPYTVEIESTGISNTVKKTLKYTFFDSVFDNAFPPPVPMIAYSEAQSGGPSGLNWYNASAVLNSNISGNVSAKPVVFASGVGIYKDSNGTTTIKSKQMYFTDTSPYSLYVKKHVSKVMNIYSDIISFRGLVTQSGTGSILNLYTYLSALDGADIGSPAVSGTKYGIIYIGGSITNITLPSGTGYYYFPNNTNLFNQTAVNKMIKISDIKTVNYTKLGTQFIYGLKTGTFK